jgi:hypothetical protein
MTWVKLLKKSQVFNNKKFPIGQLINLSTPKADELVSKKEAMYHDGNRMVVQQIKTDFFKPKE